MVEGTELGLLSMVLVKIMERSDQVAIANGRSVRGSEQEVANGNFNSGLVTGLDLAADFVRQTIKNTQSGKDDQDAGGLEEMQESD